MIRSQKLRILTVLTLMFMATAPILACTSMLVSAKASGTGRPLMWKHRDANNENNFVERVAAKDGERGYVALFNGGDVRLSEAWMGMNDAGFAVMNTASYNLAPDTARIKDREGYLMTVALKYCATVNDFERMLNTVKRPIGVQANFGVMDASGGIAYFEVNDNGYKRYNVSESDEGFLIRSNYSESGRKGEGHGYIREANLREVLKDEIARKAIRPESLTEKASKSFYHSLFNKDFEKDTCVWIVDQDFIPRESSTASVVIEGIRPGQNVGDMIMWTSLGYPPASFVVPVTLDNVPDPLRPIAEGYRSPFCNEVLKIKKNIFPIRVGNGRRYINMNAARKIVAATREKSIENYRAVYESR